MSSNPGAVITTKELSEEVNQTDNFILVDDPYLAYAKTSQLFFENYEKKNKEVESVLGENVQIGKNTVINGNCVIGDNVILHDNVSIYPCTKIGNNSIVHSGSVVGISPSLAGLIYGIGMFWDAITDPFMGYVAERTRTKWGVYRPYLLFGNIPLALSFVLLLWVVLPQP